MAGISFQKSKHRSKHLGGLPTVRNNLEEPGCWLPLTTGGPSTGLRV